jgi:hypothetical protein
LYGWRPSIRSGANDRGCEVVGGGEVRWGEVGRGGGGEWKTDKERPEKATWPIKRFKA